MAMKTKRVKKVLCFDLDGVLVDFNTGFAKLLKKINPQVQLDFMSTEFPVCWGWPQHYGYSPEDEEKAWIEAENSGMFWQFLHPYSTAHRDLELLNSLRDKHDIYFLTTRGGNTAKQESEAWLERYGFKSPTVVISGKKGEFCEAVGADILVDDKPGNLITQWTALQTALVRRPYNKSFWNYFSKTVDTVREALEDVV